MKKEKIRELWGLKRMLDISNYCELFFLYSDGEETERRQKGRALSKRFGLEIIFTLRRAIY